MVRCEEALGDGGMEELRFNRKAHGGAAICCDWVRETRKMPGSRFFRAPISELGSDVVPKSVHSRKNMEKQVLLWFLAR